MQPGLSVLLRHPGDKQTLGRALDAFALERRGAPCDLLVVEPGKETIAAAWNRAIARAKQPLLLFFDGRCRPLPGLVTRCRRFLSQHGPEDALRFATVRGASTRASALADWLWSTGRLSDQPDAPGIYAWPHFSTHALTCHRSLVRKAGFDKRFEAVEALEIAARLSRRVPLKIWFDTVPQAIFDAPVALDDALEREYLEGYFRALRVAEHPGTRTLADLADRFAFPERFALTTRQEANAVRLSVAGLEASLDGTDAVFLADDAAQRLTLVHGMLEMLFSDAAACGWLDAEAGAPPRRRTVRS